MQKERTLNVDVPPGVEEGTRIRLSGEGAAGANGGPPGDLYIFLSVTEHPIFQRDLPLLQGTILVLAMFFVLLNMAVDIVQTLLDPRVARI